MKNKNFAIALVLLFATQIVFSQKAEVDTNKSTITWQGKKVGGQHEGNILISNGFLALKDDQIEAGSFVIDMTSITNTDLDNVDYNQKLVGHLMSDDFFGVEEFPTASLILTESSKFVNGKATATGDITIKGKTERISFDVQKKGNVYTSTIELDRSKFDVRYGSKSFFDNLGDKTISDDFTLAVTLVVN